jgi:diacylglycerol kinase family enzyme
MKRLSLWEILKMLCNVSRFDKRKTEILQAKELTIKLKKPAHFQVDGEYLGKTAALHAVIKPRSLRMVLPVNDAA